MMRIRGRCFETRSADDPDWVKGTMACACCSSPARQAAWATLSPRPATSLSGGQGFTEVSACSAMRVMNSTVCTGYLPTAVSPESMTQSVPSRMAFATSEVSARVGWGFSIMLSSIWVAVITGVSAQWQASMIFFWSSGTFSGDISTPRSPRATMMPSASQMIWSRFTIASGFSIFAMIGMSVFNEWMKRRVSAMSIAVRTKESAM